MSSSLHRKLSSGTLLLVLTLLFCATASAEKIRVHYDKSLDFSKFKTYGWAPHGAVARPMLALDFVGAVEDELNARGLHKVESNPDLIIVFYRRNSAVRPQHDFAGELVVLGQLLWQQNHRRASGYTHH
jgi:Domain of unknown function (DUF4136)